jgi:hypothetical protein
MSTVAGAMSCSFLQAFGLATAEFLVCLHCCGDTVGVVLWLEIPGDYQLVVFNNPSQGDSFHGKILSWLFLAGTYDFAYRIRSPTWLAADYLLPVHKPRQVALLSIGPTIPAYQGISVAINVADVGGQGTYSCLKGIPAIEHNIADIGHWVDYLTATGCSAPARVQALFTLKTGLACHFNV